jgi:hypothetical protein
MWDVVKNLLVLIVGGAMTMVGGFWQQWLVNRWALRTETRKAIASKRVEALVELGRLSELMMLSASQGSTGQPAMRELCGQFRDQLRRVTVLFRMTFFEELRKCAGTIEAESSNRQRGDAAAHERIIGAADRAQELMRKELGVRDEV